MKYFLLAISIVCTLASATAFIETRKWSFTVLNYNLNISTPDKCGGDLNVTRVRGVGNVLSGYFDVKEDLTDDTFLELKVLKSVVGQKEFRGTPYGIPKQTLSWYMNMVYKPIIMEDLKECSVDSAQFEKFVPPLTKRRIVLNKCVIQNTNALPGVVTNGVYKARFIFTGQIRAIGDFDLRIEDD